MSGDLAKASEQISRLSGWLAARNIELEAAEAERDEAAAIIRQLWRHARNEDCPGCLESADAFLARRALSEEQG